jgi:putative flippase GtrA
MKFVVVGTIGFVVDFLTFNIVRQVIGLSPEISSIVSFCVAVLSNFLFNRYWTYPDSRSKPILDQLIQFSVVNVIGLVIRTVIFSLIRSPLIEISKILIKNINIPAIVLGENLSLGIVVIIVMFWNYFINRYWTYNDVE